MKAICITPILLLLLLTGLDSFGQAQTYSLSGTVQEGSSGQPIEFATIAIEDLNGKVLSGTTSDVDGNFSIETKSKEVIIDVSFIGFANKRISEIQWDGNAANLGVITLGEDTEMLDEVVVTAEKSTTEFKLDKRVFNVGQDLSSTGASALEVLNNVPSVSVNIEGDIALRGSTGVQILINGKPSVIASESGNAMGTITADMIDRVEVITNPSAKYEAEGSSGIINIVLKKEEKKGVNGSVSVNAGWPHNHSVGLSLNKRTENFNLFTQLGAGYREMPSDIRNENLDYATNTSILSEGEEYRNENFYNLILGSDYYIDDRNVVTLSGSFTYEIEDQPSETLFELYNSDDVLEQQWLREETTEADNPKYQYELQYKHDFDSHEDHDFLFSAIGNFFGKEQSSEFENSPLLGDIDVLSQQTETNFQEGKYIFKADYTYPFMDKWNLEAGGQYLLNDVSNDYEVRNLVDGTFVRDDAFSNEFQYNQNVLGLYTTGAYEDDVWGIKLGVRAENTDLRTYLVETQAENKQNFTNIFPTAHTSYKFSDQISLQAGYSKRIFRPRLWDLNPFFNIRNNFSIRTGNPNLLPEFTDSYEVGSIFIFQDVSMNFNVFYRYTTGVIERVVTFTNNVSTVTPVNLGTNNSYGLEWNAKYSPAKKITLNADFNYGYQMREGIFEGTSFDFNADKWTTRLTTKWQPTKAIDVELTGNYESREITVQGELADNAYMDLGFRYKIGKGRTILNLSIRDVFASRVRNHYTYQEDFYQYHRRQRGRFITLGFSYGFGKGEAMEYSGRKRH